MHFYSEVIHIIINEAYFWVSVDIIAAQLDPK